MYTPSSFVEDDPGKLHDLMESYSFATVVSSDGGEPTATHMPVLLDRDVAPHGRIVGHLARANPQWKTADGQQVLAIFHGPHAYISPTWYESDNVVPTWNYVAVHAYGTLRINNERDRLLENVTRYVDRYEAGLPSPWSLSSQDSGFIDGLLDAIVGFEIVIDRLEGKRKLNQNHDAERRLRVAKALRHMEGDNAKAIADMMFAGG